MNEPSQEELIQSLLISIDQTQCFKTKWSLIKTKLTTLQTHLLNQTFDSNHNQLCVDFLTSLKSTLTSTLSLSSLCNTPTPPHGKLKTQNDIVSISSKLDSLLHDIVVLNKSGVLEENDPISTPSSSNSTRAEVRNLVTRLQIGTTLSKSEVLDSLLGLLNEDDKNVVIAVGLGLVPVLVRLLDSNYSLEIKEKTVTCIARVAGIDSCRTALFDEGLGLLNNLVRVLECGSVFAKEKCCLALLGLSISKENARAIGCRGGIYSLLEICQDGTPGSQAMAAGVLRNLANFRDIKENFIEENAVEILLSLANSGTSLAQENAIGCLCNLVLDDDVDDSVKLSICRNGGIVSLKNFWDSAPSVQSLEVPVTMLGALATCPLISDTLVSNGFLNRVVGVLGCGVLGVRIAAAKAVYDLGYNNKTRKELGEIGCISPLVRMLEGKAIEEKQAAAKALSNLLVYAPNGRVFRKEEKGIVSAVQLLDPLVVNLDKMYPIKILEQLVHSKKCRKQIASTGASVHLKKLVDMDVEGAKKLLDNVGRGKLWGVISRH
ncbi:hypothetical protein LIER_13314 [Lithospermum erythrorhizon]|uniref:DUF7032 domain-containing protein n=1 Tax=Lithospermum erythrorhizon TaxID=34254 RepID=A0AAV3PWK2_LITER